MADFISYGLLPIILNMSLTASVVILCVLLARLLLKKAPKVFSYALWAVVLFRLLCPVSINASFSLLGLFDPPAEETTAHTSVVEYVPQDIVHTPYPEVTLSLPTVGEAGVHIISGTANTPVNNAPGSNINDIINESLPQGEEQTVADPLEAPMAIATFAWLAGILVMAVYSVISYARLKSRLVGAMRLRDNIYLADHIGSPFVMGIFRPKIYLPSSLPEQEQGYILLHEQHHIRRLDHVMKALAFVALCIHWFNPLVWLAFVLSGKDMEMSCDEAVVKKLGENIRADYSASLLSLATGRRVIAGTPLAFGEGDTKSRIKNMLNWKKPKTWIIAAGLVVCLLALVFCGTNPLSEDTVRGWLDAADCETVSIQPVGLVVLQDTSESGLVNVTDPEEIEELTELLKAATFKPTFQQFRVAPDTLAADITFESGGETFMRLLMLSSRYDKNDYSIYVNSTATDSSRYYLKAKDPKVLGQYICELVENHRNRSPVSESGSLETFLSTLHGDDIAEVEWLIDHENKPANTEVATLIRNAVNNGTVAHEPMTVNGESTDAIWSLDLRIADSDSDWDSADMLHLWAGLEENIVQIFGGTNLPEGPIWVEDEALYRLVRTSMDVPDTNGIDAEALALYQDIVDAYLTRETLGPPVVERSYRELTGFYLAAEREDLGAKIYCINTVTIVEPAEKAPYLLAGGAYVDSQLRIHPDSQNNMLVVVDGEPVGSVNWMWLEIDQGLANCKSKEDLIRAAQNFGGVVQTQQALPLEPYAGDAVTGGEEKYSIQLRTETPYFIAESGERYRLPLPYADEDLHYAALENSLLDSGSKTLSYDAAVPEHVLASDGSVLSRAGTYHYTVDLNALTYTVRFVATASAPEDGEFAPTGVVLSEISALLGSWQLDSAYTETANGGISLQELFGTALGQYGGALTIKDDRTFNFYLGALSGSGTWQPDGDTGRYTATVTLSPDGGEKRLTFYAFRKNGDSATYLALDYGDCVLFWTQLPPWSTQEKEDVPASNIFTQNQPFTDQPIEWTSPLNGMFERTYETQLYKLQWDFESTSPLFMCEQVLEFDTCAVVLGSSRINDGGTEDSPNWASVGAAYILFRDGKLGQLPLPLNGRALAVRPETVTDEGNGTLTYQVESHHYSIDPEKRTVSMSISHDPPTEEDIHAALMAHHPVEAPEGAEYVYPTEAHHILSIEDSDKEGSPVCTVYAYVNFSSFEWYGGRQKWIHPSYVVPVEMVFRWGGADYWHLTDFWFASPDDTDYESSVRARFPATVADWVLGEINSDFFAELNTRAYESAAAYYATLSGLPEPKVYTPADVNFTGQALNFQEADTLTYEERLAWVQSGAADSENSACVSLAEYLEGDGLLAYLCQWVGTPHVAQYVFNLRFADGSTAIIPLPRDGYYASALPGSMAFHDGKFIYEKYFEEDLFVSEGETLIHLKGTYHYEVDLNAKTVSLTVIQ